MDLQGKAEVAASKCSKVVQIVSKHFFGQEYTMKQLPSCSSALNFADEAHHIAMHQIVDKIQDVSHYTYASDGTSRQKKQYLERHIILADKTQLCVGFTEIASDDAKTLLEQTIEMLHELSDIYCTAEKSKEKDDVLKELISKMKCLMSDRAAVNKLFNKKMAEFRKEFLGDDTVSMHFLFCNAHFLLGLARATEEAVKEIEQELRNDGDCQLGRDNQKKFFSFSTSSESAAIRLVRTASESLGPRCDEKNGAAELWSRYCHTRNIKPKFTSYRSNRFNNVFENATATLYHHQHISDFLSNSCTHSNLKLQSVIADAADDKILSVIGAIALFNLIVTQPYWNLMNSYVPYGEFAPFVSKLDAALQHFSQSSIVESDEACSVFKDFPAQDNATKEMLFSLSSPCRKEIWSSAFQRIAQKCHIVLKRQLSDFLDGGIFCGELDNETQEILNSCPLTNLSGERLFGDMDYNMIRQRHARTHHRSSITMWKHNNTSEWLEGLSQEKRDGIMNAALKNGKKLRKKHLKQIEQVKATLDAKLAENEFKMKEKETKDGGICTSKEDLQRCNLGQLKTQVKYQKVFENQKHLKLSGSKSKLIASLLDVIEKSPRTAMLPIVSEDRSSSDSESEFES